MKWNILEASFCLCFFPAEWTGADHDYKRLAEPGNKPTEKWLLQTSNTTALTLSHDCFVSAALDTPITAVQFFS